MPIRVICPACGRVGRGPDRAIGHTVQCPACSHRHTLTADMVKPEELEFLDDEPPPKPSPAPRARPQLEPSPAPAPKPRAASANDSYDLDERPVALPKRAPISPPVVPARDNPRDRDRPSGLILPMPVLIGGAIAVTLLAILAVGVAVAVFMFRGRAPVSEPAVASESLPKPPAIQAAADTTAPAPEAAPADIPVSVAMQTTDYVAPEPVGESNVAARARAGAAAAASRDDGAGKTLSTADIVAESEPSVALVKGKGSSGTGFLVAPGLLATNAHVIDDEPIPDLEIRFVSADDKHNDPLKTELLYEDPERDLAFLAVKTDLMPLRVAKTYTFRKGEDITVIGNPGLGDGQVLENAISKGVMSTKTQIDNKNFYQLGIAINPGNSGGPVFDSSGRVIGVATLKASKQEATGFSIPIEDLQGALAKVAQQKTADADRYRSKHRINTTVKGLGGGGALMCLIIDLRRAAALSNNADVKDLLGKLEPAAAEMDKEQFPSLTAQASRIKNDPLITPQVKRMVGDMNENFARIHSAYAGRMNVDDNQLRPWKQTHKRLITDLSAALNLEVSQGMMVAFDDHGPSQPTIITMGPQSLGSLSSRLRQRTPNSAPGAPRPPSLRDRMGRRPGIR